MAFLVLPDLLSLFGGKYSAISSTEAPSGSGLFEIGGSAVRGLEQLLSLLTDIDVLLKSTTDLNGYARLSRLKLLYKRS